MKRSKILLVAPLLLLPYSISSFALSLQYRHTYIDNGTNQGRVQISHRFANHVGVTMEETFQSKHIDDNKPANVAPNSLFTPNDTHFYLNYQYKPVQNFFIQPGFNVDFSSKSNIYQAEVKFQYNLMKNLYAAVRYRYEYTRGLGDARKNDNLNREDFWLGYSIGKVSLVYGFMYRRGDHIRANNSKGEYWNNIQLSYEIDKNWKPFIEVGNVADTSNKTAVNSGRQTRYRVGLTYTF